MSTTLDSVPGSTSQPELSDSSNAPTPRFDFIWQDLSACAKYINDKGWPQAEIPIILEDLPENLVVNPQLQQILLWSLQRYEEKPTALQNNSEEQEDAEGPCTNSQVKLPSRTNTVTSLLRADGNELTRTLSRTRSQKSSPLVARLKQLRQDVASKKASSVPSSSSSNTDTSNQEPGSTAEVVNPNGECISCFDEHPKRVLVHLACSHDYCKACLREVVLNAIKNESAFPPKCCLTEIPRKTILVCLESNQRDEYREKSAEYAIPAGHRWYCPEPKCSRWIKPEKLHRNRRDHQKCPHCKARICSTCRSLAHDDNQDCPQDFGLESTLEVAESEGWRRCYSCRMMVELTTGCRHITCRCGAEFCYVCNARWRTCNCTEADKERRIRELRAQREQRSQMAEEEAQRREEEDEVARLEAEEMAEAIRQVEEMERQEAIRRVEEERQRQLEEELILAQLEEVRLLEEIARREQEEEAERQFREILITSSKEECHAMMKTLMQIINHQHATLMSNHATQEQNAVDDKEIRLAQRTSEADTMLSWLQDNVDARTLALNAKQQAEWEALLLQAENEEDDMFMQMHMYLRDKPNREQREKKMRDTFHTQQREKTDELQQRHQRERQIFEKSSEYEFEGLRKFDKIRLEPVEKEHTIALHHVAHRVGCDRRWFQLVSARRINMLNEHKDIVLLQLEAEMEPIGLTEDQARLILARPNGFEGGMSSTDSAPIGGLPPVQEETSDLYGATGGETTSPLMQSATSNLGRSDTVIRSIPGAFPSQPTTTSSTAVPIRSALPISTSDTITIPSPLDTPKQTSIMDRPHPRNHPPEQFPPIQATDIDTINPLLTTQTSTSTLSTLSNTSTSTPSATPTSSRTSKYSQSSTSTSFSTSDADILDTISSTILAKHISASGPQKKKSLGTMLRGFGKKKEISDEEIRRRMSTVVSDGWGN